MVNKNINKKEKPTSGFNISSISGVLNIISLAFSLPEEPADTPPPLLILAGGKLRPGMSASAITARIISRLSEANLPVGNVFADGPNTTEALIKIITEEYVNSLQTEAVITGVMAPGITVESVGIAVLGGPVVSKGTTMEAGIITGVIT